MQYLSALFFLGFFFLGQPHTLVASSETNPFVISFPATKALTKEDYREIQRQLSEIEIMPLLENLYSNYTGNLSIHDFYRRISRGIKQVLIDPNLDDLPTLNLQKIGNGSGNCIVTFASCNGPYPSLVAQIPDALRSTGFNGYFLSLVGGFPNPTGQEIQYAGVPYSFKIFMMLEAQQLGFDRVLWLDSAMLPLQDPSPLFDLIDKNGSLFIGGQTAKSGSTPFFTETHQLLHRLTNVDFLEETSIIGCVFGLRMNSGKMQRFLDEYYRMVKLGTPFLSCFPEEIVLATIIAKVNRDDLYDPDVVDKSNNPWNHLHIPMLFQGSDNTGNRTIEKLRESGYFFYQSLKR